MAAATASQRPLLPSAGRELLLDLKRSAAAHAGPAAGHKSTAAANASNTLPTYNTKLVQACQQSLANEFQELGLVVKAIFREEEEDRVSMPRRPVVLLHNESIRRHKRCLLAYHYQRMEMLKEIVRRNHKEENTPMETDDDADDAVPKIANTAPAISQNQHEVQFAKTYRDLRSHYAATVGIDLDLPMPVSSMVMIRVVEELGQVILPSSGRQVLLQQGAVLFVERADAVDLLQQGAVQLCSKTEEVDF